MRHSLQHVTLLTILSLQMIQGDEGHCVWYGQCGESSTTQKELNCYYNGTAKRVLDEQNGQKLLAGLQTLCPNIYKGENTTTCCNYNMFMTLSSNMQIPAAMLSRCPSCWHDFRDLYCASTCDPHQSNFIQVLGVNGSPGSVCTNPPCTVSEIKYLVTRRYANTLFNACRHVQFPSSNQPVISALCGSYTPAQCNAQRFLNFQGSNPLAPFPIIFNVTDKYPHYKPYNQTLYRCDQPVSGSHCGFHCSCSDCPKSCVSSPVIPKPAPSFKIGSVDGVMVIIIIIYSVFLIVFVPCWLIRTCRSRSERIETHESTHSSKQSLSASTPYSSVRQDLDDLMAQQALLDNRRDTKSAHYSSVNEENGSEELRPYNNSEPESIKDAGCITRAGLSLEITLIRFFRWWGTLCASYPLTVISLSIITVLALSCGIIRLTVTTNPVELWSAPTSRSRLEKNYFDSHFGPFYRTEQVIIRAPNVKPYNYTDQFAIGHPTTLFGGVFNKSVLTEVYWLQYNITNLMTKDGVRIGDICFQPLDPDNKLCAIESVLQYFQNNLTRLDMTYPPGFLILSDDYHSHLKYCFNDPTSPDDSLFGIPCLADYGGIVPANVGVGGYNDSSLVPPYTEADTLFLTIIVNNHVDELLNKKAEAWEELFIDYLKNYKSDLITIAYKSESSITAEIHRESASDAITIVISYILMFVYVAIFLGHIQSVRRLLLDSKVSLGLAGVLIVLSAVLSSIGLFSYFGQPVTLIVIEVIPFLVLAVGVDNIFILVQAFQRRNLPDQYDLADQVGIVLGQVAPSMLLTGLSESVAFFLGALTIMPAVRSFSLCAGMAILIDFLLQITCFVALLYLDAKRQQRKRIDIMCCVRDKNAPESAEGSQSLLYTLMRDYYSKFVLNDIVRAIVMTVFVGGFSASLVAMNHLHVGLDQKVSMPTDSYLQDYFKDLAEYARVGPPVYFVIKDGINYSNPDEQNRICSLPGCNNNSVTAQVSAQAKIKHYSKIANAPNSWLDDYFSWVSPNTNCCRVYVNNGDFCKSSVSQRTSDCEKCLNQSDLMTCFSPKPNKFYHYLHYFLKDNPSQTCSKGGHAAYGKAVDFKTNSSITSSYFSSFHTALAIDTDFIDALKRAREISDNLTLALEGTAKVFPYSYPYVFYEQYLTIVHDAAVNLALCAAAIFVITFLLMGFNLPCAIIVTLTVSMIVVDLMGVMYLWDISFNAVSVVNLVMAVGISVEFCSHITRSFAVSREPNRVTRARHALVDMGSSVLSGITLTKFVGIVVLAFSKSQLFEIFYFRMYLSVVLLGASHGLMFLPVLLSYVGPSAMPSAKMLMQSIKVPRQPVVSDSTPSSTHRAFYRSTSPTTVTIQSDPDVVPPVETSRLLGNAGH